MKSLRDCLAPIVLEKRGVHVQEHLRVVEQLIEQGDVVGQDGKLMAHQKDSAPQSSYIVYRNSYAAWTVIMFAMMHSSIVKYRESRRHQPLLYYCNRAVI
jgi:hypothetical protein